jgi:hypothetical protein
MNNEDNRGQMEHSCLISMHDSKPSVRPATGNPLFVVFLYITLMIKNISPFTLILTSLCSKRCLSTECRFKFVEYRIAFPLSFICRMFHQTVPSLIILTFVPIQDSISRESYRMSRGKLGLRHFFVSWPIR